MSRFLLTLLFAVPALRGRAAEFPLSASSSSNVVVAWGKSANGLRVGISCDTATADSRRLPEIFFHIANDGDREIKGIIQSGSECIVTVNGRHYTQESWGGISSWMPPGRKYGPIQIDTERLRQIPELRPWNTINRSAVRPELQEGTNTLSLYYRLGTNLVGSGAIQVVAKGR